jgi:threonine 3-dehydrogenase
MARRNLIIGGMGMFGRYLARTLLEAKEEVALFDREDRLPPGFEGIKGRVETTSGDIASLPHVLEAVRKSSPDCIFHVAALMGAPCENSPAAGYSVNIQGTFHVLEAARLLGVRQVLFPSSRATFGPDTPAVVTGDMPQRPTVMYGVTKVCGELLGEYYGRRYGFDFRALRFPVVVGAGRLLTTPLVADVNKIIEAAVAGTSFLSGLDPQTSINIIYVKEVIEAFLQFRNADGERLSRRTYNITGLNVVPAQMVETLKQILPRTEVAFKPDESEAALRLRKAMSKQMDESLARKDWGWQPRFSVEGMINDFVEETRRVRAADGAA